MTATLFLVPTPIGNLEDITLRALRTLREVDLIACEDTRHTRKLLAHFDIHTPTISCHEHNERHRIDLIVEHLRAGRSVALVSDAGTPGISDPGNLIVPAVIDAQFPVVALPGPCALTTALTASGLETHSFYFAGFLSPKSPARRAALENLRPLDATLVLYEAPHRIHAFLDDACAILGDRPAVVARELTKQFEEFLRGPLSQLAAHFTTHEARGEMVVVISGKPAEETTPSAPTDSLLQTVERLMSQQNLSANEALKILAQARGVPKRELYKQWVAEMQNDT